MKRFVTRKSIRIIRQGIIDGRAVADCAARNEMPSIELLAGYDPRHVTFAQQTAYHRAWQRAFDRRIGFILGGAHYGR